jgi:ubiquitin-protein ligase
VEVNDQILKLDVVRQRWSSSEDLRSIFLSLTVSLGYKRGNIIVFDISGEFTEF